MENRKFPLKNDLNDLQEFISYRSVLVRWVFCNFYFEILKCAAYVNVNVNKSLFRKTKLICAKQNMLKVPAVICQGADYSLLFWDVKNCWTIWLPSFLERMFNNLTDYLLSASSTFWHDRFFWQIIRFHNLKNVKFS
jgi:hypothetical protein